MSIRISAGHVYDAEKARVVGSYYKGEPFDIDASNIPPTSMFERLQRTKSGRYFVFGIGGADTRYAARADGTWTPGSKITPLSSEDANAWAKRHLTHSEWQAEFGEPAPDELCNLSVKIPAIIYRKIRNEAAQRGISMGEVVAERFNEPSIKE